MHRLNKFIGFMVMFALIVGSVPATKLSAAPRPCPPDCPPPPPPPPPTNRTPFGYLEEVVRQADKIHIRGWAIDPDAKENPIAVHVYADNKFVTGFAADIPRGDVAAVYPNYKGRHGFDTLIPSAGRTICVYAINVTPQGELQGDNPPLGCGDVPVDPFGYLEEVVRQPGQIHIRGWAIDPDTTDPIGIHVYTGDKTIFITGFGADIPRGDVAAVYPGYLERHGFDITINRPDMGAICIYAVNVGPGNSNLLGCSGVQWFDTTAADRVASGYPITNRTKVDWGTANKSANNFCQQHGYDTGLYTGHQSGELMGVNCMAEDVTDRMDVSTSEFGGDHPRYDNEWIANEVATFSCNARGYNAGFFTDRALHTILCIPRARTTGVNEIRAYSHTDPREKGTPWWLQNILANEACAAANYPTGIVTHAELPAGSPPTTTWEVTCFN